MSSESPPSLQRVSGTSSQDSFRSKKTLSELLTSLSEEYEGLDLSRPVSDSLSTDVSLSSQYYSASLNDTLATLERTSPIISSPLLKLTPSHTWTPRFLVLLPSSQLFLFKNNPTASTHPTTFLPITSFSSVTNPIYGSYLLTVTGDGITTEGVFTKRTWTFKCRDAGVQRVWIDALQGLNLSASAKGGDVESIHSADSGGASRVGRRMHRDDSGALSLGMSRSVSRGAGSMESVASAAAPLPPALGIHRSKSQGRITGYRDVSSRSGHRGSHAQIQLQPSEVTDRRKHYFSMPSASAEDAMNAFLERREVERKAGEVEEERKRAVAERIAASKKAREGGSVGPLLVTNVNMSGMFIKQI
ncbi:hypothetical protein HDU98_004605 [Podochytrium sp. JEL0797]|nr:hypothetical protein HDU98_004605 [Podochytrium sp. JEL0797]